MNERPRRMTRHSTTHASRGGSSRSTQSCSRGCIALGRESLGVMSAAVAHVAHDVSGIVDLDLLQGELDAARGQVEMWCAQRELSMKEAVAAHKTNMMESEEQYVKLVEKEKDLAASGEELVRRKEYERGELEALREEAAQAKELGEGLPQQLQALRLRVKNEEKELKKKLDVVDSQEAVEKRTLDAHVTAARAYRERLGLRFEIGREEDVKFFFKNVDPKNHEREFMVAVRVRGDGGYELVDADPDIENLTASLDRCNASDNLSKFVREARGEFRKLVAAEEVKAAARAAEEAKKMPPLPAAELEPPPTPLRALGEDMVPL